MDATDYQLDLTQEQKEELHQLACAHCNAPLKHIERGYHSCPGCGYQMVEPRSNYWTSNLPFTDSSQQPASFPAMDALPQMTKEA